MVKEVGRKLIAQNKKARHDYSIEDVYECGNHPPRRDRKLLVHRTELDRLTAKLKEGGLTLIPLTLYFKDGKAKIELAVARGKKSHDKRAALLEREMGREAEREVSRRRSGKSSER
jgi:SsrA-binding protein